jgi:undecaprenyl-diphosphatase
MEIYQAILLGIVEGVTEFLPISSTFHLIFTAQFLGLEQTEFLKFFTVFIQAGGILAVLFIYGKELWQDHELIKKILFSFVPTSIFGFLLYKLVKDTFFESNWLMLSVFIFFGLIFIFYERYLQKNPSAIGKDLEELSWQQSMLVGVFQTLAIVPGVSRSGAVILIMLLLGQKRASAAKYSFLLAIPTILSTAVFDLAKTQESLSFSPTEIIATAIGFLVSFAVALVVLRWLIGYLQKNSLAFFGYYRLGLGLILLALL